MLKILLIAAAYLIFCGLSYGDSSIPNTRPYLLITSTTDANKIVTKLSLLLDNDSTEIKGLRSEDSNGKVSVFEFEKIRSKGGAVLLRQSDRDIVRMMGNEVDPKTGGPFQLIYLYNGISDAYRKADFEINLNGDIWSVNTNDQAGRKVFDTMFLKAHRWMGKVVGIAKIYAPAPKSRRRHRKDL